MAGNKNYSRLPDLGLRWALAAWRLFASGENRVLGPKSGVRSLGAEAALHGAAGYAEVTAGLPRHPAREHVGLPARAVREPLLQQILDPSHPCVGGDFLHPFRNDIL